jgi:hypothetical protein
MSKITLVHSSSTFQVVSNSLEQAAIIAVEAVRSEPYEVMSLDVKLAGEEEQVAQTLKFSNETETPLAGADQLEEDKPAYLYQVVVTVAHRVERPAGM